MWGTKTYGTTVFGVADYDYKIATAPGEYTHLAFVAGAAAKKTDLYVNGVLKGSVPAAIALSGPVGIGYERQGADASGSFDNFDGSIFGVAIYDRALSDAEIAANSAAFLEGGPEAVTLDLKSPPVDDDAEEHLNRRHGHHQHAIWRCRMRMTARPPTTDRSSSVCGTVLALPKGARSPRPTSSSPAMRPRAAHAR